MTDLLQHVDSVLERESLVPEGTRLIVGLSGGADSVALLHLLHRLGLQLAAAHLHHGIRGAEADSDEAFVGELCAQLDIPCICERADVPLAASSPSLSLEMAARNARLSFFSRIAADMASEGAPVRIALGHHADDQVETFFLRLTRGTGPGGLGGMKPLQRIGDLTVIRPLLDVRRTDLLQWLQDSNIPWREDSTNQNLSHARNRVRHEWIPLLRQLNPKAEENILRTMRILREEDRLLDALTRDNSDPSLHNPLPPALQRRVICRELLAHGITPSVALVERVEAFAKRTDGTREMHLGPVRLINEYGRLRYVPCGETSRPQVPEQVIQLTHGTGILRGPWHASVSVAKVGGRDVTVRSARPGDRMLPYGMKGHRKIQDILTDLRIPRRIRAGWPVVECGGEIIWVPGYRIATGWEVPDETSEALHMAAPELKRIVLQGGQDARG